MNILQTLSQLPGITWHTPSPTKAYTLYPGTYKGVGFYVYSIDGDTYMGLTGGCLEVLVTNPVTNLESLVLGV